MSSDFNPDRKNTGFLSQFFNETLYYLPEEIQKKETVQEEIKEENKDTETTVSKPENSILESQEETEKNSDANTSSDPAQEKEDEENKVEEPEITKEEAANESNYEEESIQETPQPENNTNQENEPASAIDYYGEFQRPFLILVAYHNQKHLIRKDELVLTRILQALDLSLQDVAIVNIYKEHSTFEDLQNAFKFNQLIGFGISPEFIPLNIQLNEIKQLNDEQMITLAPPIEEIAASKDQKRKLWNNLKQLFNK